MKNLTRNQPGWPLLAVQPPSFAPPPGATPRSRPRGQPPSRLFELGLAALLATLAGGALKAEGIPEPGIVLYGVVRHVDGATDVRLTSGALTWVFQPATGGQAVTASAALQNINDQFSYVLRVPCETALPGFPISSNALPLSLTPVIYNRSQVRVDGEAAYFVEPALSNLTLNATSRGQFQRVDLILHSAGPDFATWALRMFGSADVNPNADADGDGLSNWAEFRAGTDPRDARSQFAFVAVEKEPAGGMRIQWSSVPGRSYTVERSTDLLSGFVQLKAGEPATAPINLYHDATATGPGPFFYRLRVD